MNNVQITYAPPRVAALAIGVLTFAIYQLGWRNILDATENLGDPVALPLAILFSLIIGYGLTMLGWLVMQTRGQIGDTFRPTRGRVLGAMGLLLVTPFVVFNWLPWIFAGLIPMVFSDMPLWGLLTTAIGLVILYPLSSMIVRHTYERRLLRFGLFCLYFWTGYAFLMLWHGEMAFRI